MTSAELAVLQTANNLMIMMFLLILILPLYILGSLGLMKIAERQGIQYNWIAWLPVSSSYLLGKVETNESLAWVLTSFSFLIWFTSWTNIPTAIYWALLLAGLIIGSVALYNIYKRLSRHVIPMTIITFLSLGILGPIFLFAIRNNPILEDPIFVEREERQNLTPANERINIRPNESVTETVDSSPTEDML